MDGSQELVQLPPFTDAHRAFLQIMLVRCRRLRPGAANAACVRGG